MSGGIAGRLRKINSGHFARLKTLNVLYIPFSHATPSMEKSTIEEAKSKPKVHLAYGHAPTWHDEGATLLLGNRKIVSLASERVGDRMKHSWDSHLTYKHFTDLYDFSEVLKNLDNHNYIKE